MCWVSQTSGLQQRTFCIHWVDAHPFHLTEQLLGKNRLSVAAYNLRGQICPEHFQDYCDNYMPIWVAVLETLWILHASSTRKGSLFSERNTVIYTERKFVKRENNMHFFPAPVTWNFILCLSLGHFPLPLSSYNFIVHTNAKITPSDSCALLLSI